MFIQTWNKYLPIIKILLKRSVHSEQTLDMNSTDFQRAAGGRKVKYSFAILLVKGRPQNIDAPPPVAKDLIAALQQDDVSNKFIRQNQLEINMTSGFKLHIRNTTPAPEPEPSNNDGVNTSEKVKSDDGSAVTE
jgi:hypothetical protein